MIHIVKRLLTPIVILLAVLYFLLDGIFLSFVRPMARSIGRLAIFPRLRAWITSRDRYTALALVAVPWIILEPAKPVGVYLLGQHRWLASVTVFSLSEIIKLTLVERMYHLNYDKLMTFAVVRWAHRHVSRWMDMLKALPAWQRTRRLVKRVAAMTAAVLRRIRVAWQRA